MPKFAHNLAAVAEIVTQLPLPNHVSDELALEIAAALTAFAALYMDGKNYDPQRFSFTVGEFLSQLDSACKPARSELN